MLFKKTIDWLLLRDLDCALADARVNVIKRYARGNVTFQNGYILDDAALEKLRVEGDEALAELVAQQAAHARNESRRIQ